MGEGAQAGNVQVFELAGETLEFPTEGLGWISPESCFLLMHTPGGSGLQWSGSRCPVGGLDAIPSCGSVCGPSTDLPAFGEGASERELALFLCLSIFFLKLFLWPEMPSAWKHSLCNILMYLELPTQISFHRCNFFSVQLSFLFWLRANSEASWFDLHGRPTFCLSWGPDLSRGLQVYYIFSLASSFL